MAEIRAIWLLACHLPLGHWGELAFGQYDADWRLGLACSQAARSALDGDPAGVSIGGALELLELSEMFATRARFSAIYAAFKAAR